MVRTKLICLVVLLLAVSVLTSQQASAQAVYGSILGTVTDAQGAVVPNAKITVTSLGKGTVVTGTTNESGNYTVTHLIPDVYRVRFEAASFKALEQKEVNVTADNGSRVDASLVVGGASETVEVTAEAPQLKTDRADVAIEFSGKQLAELPILNRNFQSLELLSPGTQIITGWAHAATENPQGSKQIFVNGQHFSGTGFELDGTDNADPILGIIIVNPSLDAVTETKIATQNYDAEFGKATAGIMSAQTKSGTNELHGSGYFYDLNPKAPAKDPFTGSAAANSWKQYGASLGGALIKNKLFFFGDYEGTRRVAGTSYKGTVPTALVRSSCLTAGSANCDLSEYLAAGLSGGGQVYNPYQVDGSRTAYANNVIPQATLQSYDQSIPTGLTTGEKILALLPAPNTTGTNNGTQNNYTKTGSGTFNDYQYVVRGDYFASQKLQLFGRYTHGHFSLGGAPVYGNTIGGGGLGYLGLGGQSLINNYSLASGFNYTVSNTLLTDVRFGYFRYNPHSTKFDQGNSTAASSLGLAGLNTSDATTNGLPGFFFDGTLSAFGEGLNVTRCNCPLIEKEQGYQITNNWTKIVGDHQFKFGADLRHATNLRVPSDANRTGILNFSHLGTSNSGGGGLDLATFLFSEVTSFNRYVGSAGEPSAVETQNRYFLYGQDTWRATHKLTVNYGLRWEYYTPESVNKKGNGGYAVLPEGVIRVAGYGSNSLNGSTRGEYKNFAPRLGIAYQITPKTVLRMGYGRSFDIGVFGSLFGHTVTQNLPVLANQSLVAATNNSRNPAFNFSGQPCLQAVFIAATCGPTFNVFPVIPSNGILPLFGPAGTVSPHTRPDRLVAPTVDAWNVSFQTQVTKSMTLELAYVANHGSHVFKGNGPTYNVNQATIVGCQGVGCGTGLSYNARSPFNTTFNTPYTDALGNTTNVVCCSGQGIGYAGNDGVNRYRAIQVKATQRAGSGLTLLAHYTYAKAYDNDGSYQPDLRQGTGRQDYNRDSVFIVSSLYELPFGRGKRFLGNTSRAADLVVGGWQWNSAITIASGLPFSPGYSICNEDRDTGPCRPTLAAAFGSVPMSAGKFDPKKRQVVYFTPVVDQANVLVSLGGACPDNPLARTNACTGNGVLLNGDCAGGWCRPGIGAFGNTKRNSLTGPGEWFADMSLFKNFSITERVKAQFQAEFFNVFNHAVLNGPGNCVDCSGSGLITSLQGDSHMRQFQIGLRATF